MLINYNNFKNTSIVILEQIKHKKKGKKSSSLQSGKCTRNKKIDNHHLQPQM